MKKLTQKELESIQKHIDSPQFIYYKKMMESKFSLGDVLIKRMLDNDNGEDTLATYDDEDSNFPVRFLVVHVDQTTGLSFVKMYDGDGELEDEILPTYDPNEYDGEYLEYYEVDPAYVNATIVGEEFNIKELFDQEAQRKQRHIDFRKSNSFQFDELGNLHDFLESLPKGQKLWMQNRDSDKENWDWDDISDYWSIEGETIVSVEPIKRTVFKKAKKGAKKAPAAIKANIKAQMMASLPKKNKSLSNLLIDLFDDEPEGITEEVDTGENNYTFSGGDEISSSELLEYYFYTSKPPEVKGDI